jgi:hypothetical protein
MVQQLAFDSFHSKFRWLVFDSQPLRNLVSRTRPTTYRQGRKK